MKIFIICSVRDATQKYRDELEAYTSKLERDGITVHLPHRDTDQTVTGIGICTQNKNAIMDSDEVHIFYNRSSQGTHFDMGMAFVLKKKIVLVSTAQRTAEKSFQNTLVDWEANGCI